MRIAIFFVYLFLFLLNGNESLQAAAPFCAPGNTDSQSVQIINHEASVAINDAGSIITHCDTTGQTDYSDIDEVEDEDANNSLPRKFKVTDSYYTAFSYHTQSGYLLSRSKSTSFFCGRVSYIYILQSVLKV